MNSGDKYKDEYWGELPGFSRYLISSYGRIMVKEHITCEDKRNRKRHFDSRLLKLTLTKDRDGSGGYYHVRLKDDNGDVKTYLVHRIVAKTFIPNPENKETVNHKNGIKNDNRVENLEWSTYRENNIHAYCNDLKSDNIRVIALDDASNTIIDFYYSISEATRNTNIKREIISEKAKSGEPYKGIRFYTIENFIEKFNKLGVLI